MAAERKGRRRPVFRSGKIKAKRISERMKARRQKRARNVETVYETPITLRSKFAWITIILMLLVIIAASIRVHPPHYIVEYDMTETGENPYMGTLDAENGYLVSLDLAWNEYSPAPDEYIWPLEAAELDGCRRYVVRFDADSVPQYVLAAARESDDAQKYIDAQLRKCINNLMRAMDARGDCAYLQTEAALDKLPGRVGGIYLLTPVGDGTYRVPDGDEKSWINSPVAGTAENIFGNHLTYLLDGEGVGPLAGRVGYALGVRNATWHSTTRQCSRLFVNLTIDNAGVTRLYQKFDLVLTLWRAGKCRAGQVQAIDLREVMSEPVELAGYIDIPYNLEKGEYRLCVSINDSGTAKPALSLTMPAGQNGYYELGKVTVK